MQDRVKEYWQIRKASVSSSEGLVATQHHLASDIGARILSAGGNAIDAAIAAGLALGVAEPWMSGLGGGGFMTVYLAKTKSVKVVEFGMCASENATADDYPLLASGENSAISFNWPSVEGDKNIHGPLSIAVPGYVKGMSLALDNFGTMPWKEIIEPACQLAEFGLPIDWYSSGKINLMSRGLASYEETRKTYLADGLPPAADLDGKITGLKLGNLAHTYRRLQHEGPNSYYTGSLANDIAQDLQLAGSRISLNDLNKYEAVVTSPLTKNYRGNKISVSGELTAGSSLIHALTSTESSISDKTKNIDTDTYKKYIEALMASYQHRLSTLGAGNPSGNTTHISTSDKEGNVVSLTQTIMSGFGSRIMLPKTGLLMNNGMMWFDPRPNTPNSVVGGRYPLCNMCPTIIEKKNGNVIAVGACGGRKIFPSVFQLVSFMLDYDMSVEEALHQPRIDNSGSNDIAIMDSMNEKYLDELLALYPEAKVRPNGVMPNLFALPQMVEREHSGMSVGGCFIPSPHAKVSVPSQ
ncbi:MAG: gamma-glutamyltranspeptidase/glutathione hydrolase [Candidatus Azotimanducaceae bacterium]|jgi:gamma-glutamyltranspeptidase/glutathione hydrolase